MKTLAFIVIALFMIPFIIQIIMSLLVVFDYITANEEDRKKIAPLMPFSLVVIGVTALGVYLGCG